MTQIQNAKKYDLEDRTFEFARQVRTFAKGLPKSVANFEDGKQVIRSSGSVGANYIEANEALSKKDTLYRMKICRKEAKESGYWLRLVSISEDEQMETKQNKLVQEAKELMNIFGAIIRKLE